MNSLATVCVALVWTSATAWADPTDRFIIAAMSLTERPNYSWFTLLDDESGAHEVEGRTDATGITWLRMPMTAALAARLGAPHERQVDVFHRPPETYVIRTSRGWACLSELPERPLRTATERPRPLVRGSANAGNFGMAGGPTPSSASRPGGRRPRDDQNSATFGVTPPNEELALIVSSFAEPITRDGDALAGTLTDLGAALLLVRAEHRDVEPLAAQGEFKLWLKDGAVVRYQLRLEGMVLIGGRRKLAVRSFATTTLRDIGTTRIEVPTDARARLP